MWGWNAKTVIESDVPGGHSIELVSWYKKFEKYYPTCELQSKRWMVENIKDDWVCLDAGANIGYHSILMARLATQGSVHAFEPTKTFSMLQKNVRHSELKNLILNRVALGSSSHGGGRLYRIWGSRPETYSGEWTTVDDYLQGLQSARLDFLKIDVDGYDLEVLHGAKEAIAAYKPVVLVEVNHALATRQKTASDVFAFMLDNKYSSAFVLDKDNYVFTSSWQLGDPWPSELVLQFDFRDALQLSEGSLELSSNSTDIPSALIRTQNKTKEKGRMYAATGPAWQYCLKVSGVKLWGRGKSVQVDVKVSSGDLGVFFTDARGKKVLGPEKFVNAEIERTLVFPTVPEGARALVFRKTSGVELSFELSRIRAGGLTDSAESRKYQTKNEAPLSFLPSSQRIGARESGASLGLKNRVKTGTANELAKFLGIPTPLPDLESRSKFDARQHTMEREDAPYLRWIWSSLLPDKHFEFGTWEGFGTCLVLNATNAHVWTINLEHGEHKEAQAQYSSSREPALRKIYVGGERETSDSGTEVGWMYRALGLGSRVTQMFGDSLELDHLDLGKASIDTIFIDGGHSTEVVSSDQAKAIEMLKSGGVVVWHDFSMDVDLVSMHPACKGVVSAVLTNIDFLESRLNLFSLDGTFLLIGQKR